jgi:tetratricopeptide (TPR) repeat protein
MESRRNKRTEVRGKNGDKRRPTRDDFRQESHTRDNMKDKPLEDVRSSIERFSRAAEKGMPGRDERLLKEIHHLCCLIADRNNGMGIAALREIAQKLASLSEEFGGHDEIAATIYNFGSGFALLRASAFSETIPQFEEISPTDECLWTIELAASCFCCVAGSLGGALEQAFSSLSRAKRLVDRIPDAAPCCHGLVAMAEASLLYKTGRHESTIELIERHRDAFSSASAALNSQFPYFQAQALLAEAKALRDVGRYTDALDLLYHERKLRALIDDLLGQVWSLLEEARIRRFRREFESAAACLGLASHYVAGTDLHEYRARIADQRGDIHCTNRELDKAEANYKLAQETADAAGQLWLQAHVGNSIARLRLVQGRPAVAKQILESFEPVWKQTKNYGKYLYLLGRTEAALGNYGNAEQIYRSALENLKTFGLRSTEALTRDRLAQLLMKLGRKEEACVEWARALKLSETVQAVRLFEDITKRYAEQVKAEELLPIIEDAMVQRMEMQARIDGSHLRLGRAEDLIWREHYVLAHWFVQPIWHMLRCEDRNASRLPPVINEFCKAFGNPVWLSRMLTGHLSTSAEDIDVRILCKESVERVSRMFRTELSLTIASEIATIATDEYILRQAFDALFRGLYSAFRTTAFELSQCPRVASAPDQELFLILALKEPVPDNFARASDLVRINVAMKDESLRPFFDADYTGDLSLADFFIGVVLGEKLSFHTDPPTVEIRFQTRHKRPTR